MPLNRSIDLSILGFTIESLQLEVYLVALGFCCDLHLNFLSEIISHRVQRIAESLFIDYQRLLFGGRR